MDISLIILSIVCLSFILFFSIFKVENSVTKEPMLPEKKERFPSTVTKKADNTSILIFPDKWTGDFMVRFEHHEPFTNLKLKEILEYLPEKSHIVDVGSHVGDTGLYLAKILKDVYPQKDIKVIMIDPDESKIQFIKKMGMKNQLNNIITHVKGVDENIGYGSLDKKLHPGAWKIQNRNGTIKLDTLDNICKGKKVSLLHIDVEGMEYQCLLGSQEILKDTHYVMIELNRIRTSREKEKDLLEKHGFVNIENKNIEKENHNALFQKNSI